MTFWSCQFGEIFLIHRLPSICTALKVRCASINCYAGTGVHGGTQEHTCREHLGEADKSLSQPVKYPASSAAEGRRLRFQIIIGVARVPLLRAHRIHRLELDAPVVPDHQVVADFHRDGHTHAAARRYRPEPADGHPVRVDGFPAPALAGPCRDELLVPPQDVVEDHVSRGRGPPVADRHRVGEGFADLGRGRCLEAGDFKIGRGRPFVLIAVDGRVVLQKSPLRL